MFTTPISHLTWNWYNLTGSLCCLPNRASPINLIIGSHVLHTSACPASLPPSLSLLPQPHFHYFNGLPPRVPSSSPGTIQKQTDHCTRIKLRHSLNTPRTPVTEHKDHAGECVRTRSRGSNLSWEASASKLHRLRPSRQNQTFMADRAHRPGHGILTMAGPNIATGILPLTTLCPQISLELISKPSEWVRRGMLWGRLWSWRDHWRSSGVSLSKSALGMFSRWILIGKGCWVFLHNASLGVLGIVFRILEKRFIPWIEIAVRLECISKACIHYSVLATSCKSALLLTFFMPTSLLHKTSENGWIL